jgi:transmembrane protein 17
LILFAFALLVVFEIIRLYLGYVGNLNERVPELTGFWLITIMIQLPMCIFLLVIVWININDSSTATSRPSYQVAKFIPMQFSMQLLHFLFILFESIFGFIALRVLARYQISRFHYKQFDDNQFDSLKQKNNDDWLTNLQKTTHFQLKTMKNQGIDGLTIKND